MHSNYPYRVLPSGSGVAILGAGSTTEALALGQLGIFDADTGLSLDAAGAAGVRNFFIALGASKTGGSVKNFSLKSQGQQIAKDAVMRYALRCYNPGQNQITRIQTIKRDPECDREWGLKLEFRGNSKLYSLNGHNRVVRTYVARTPCCDPGSTADSRDLVYEFYTQIKADYDAGHIPVNPLIYEEGADIDNPGATINDYATWKAAAAATDYIGIQLEVEPLAAMTYCEVPPLYYRLNAFRLHLSPMGDFFCSDGAEFGELNAEIKDVQLMQYPEGAGSDLRFQEYESAGYTQQNQHRLGTEQASSGLPLPIAYRADNAGTYSVLELMYEDRRSQGSRQNNRQMATTVAFLQADNANLIAFLTILDVLVPERALADDAATCAGTVAETSSKTVEVEGVEVN